MKKIFYGWYILAVGMIGAFLSAGSSQLFMSIMLKPLTAEFGWSRTETTGAITTGTILAGLLALPFGIMADRYGPRVLTTAGALISALMYFLLTKCSALWEFYLFFVTARIVSTNTLSSIVPRTAAVNWFRRFRGRAIGLLSMATPLGSSFLAFLAQLIMENHGWRSVFQTFAWVMVVFQAIPAGLILRRRPEDLGLKPDGVEQEVDPLQAAPKNVTEEEHWTLREALKTSSLWYITGASVLGLMVNAGIGFHLVAYYTDVGIAAYYAVGAMSIYALTGAFGNALWGFLSETISERLLAMYIMLLTALAIFYLQGISGTTDAFLFAVFFGLTSRGEGTLVNVLVANYYGRRSFGTINGFIYPFNMLGLGFGPLMASFAFDMSGSYRGVFYLFMGLSLIAALLLWLARKPKKS